MDFPTTSFEDEQLSGANGLSIDWQHSGEVDGDTSAPSWNSNEMDNTSISYFQDLFKRAVRDDTRKTNESAFQAIVPSSGTFVRNTIFGNKRKGKQGHTQEKELENGTRVRKKKKIYHIPKNKGQIVGVKIKPQYPKNYHILIKNDFKKNTSVLSDELILKIKRLIKTK